MNRAIGLMFGLITAGILIDRARLAMKAKAGVKKMVPDSIGNYDLDGVSYDSQDQKVVVGSDSRVKEPCATSGLNQVESAEKLA